MIKLCTILNVRSEEDITQKFEESASAYLKSDYKANEPIFDVTLQVKTESHDCLHQTGREYRTKGICTCRRSNEI